MPDRQAPLAAAALHKASERGKGDIIRELLDAGADPDLATAKTTDTALHLAAVNGHTDACSELVKVGADVNASNKIGWNPLHCAMYSNKLDIARILTRAGADASEPNKKNGVAPRDVAVRSDPHQIEAISVCCIPSCASFGRALSSSGRHID